MITPATPEAIANAASLIGAGKLVAFPTETVYGLGADATNPDAVAKVFSAKARPSCNPLIVHVASWEMADAVADISGDLRALCEAVWPGPLTVVAPRRPDADIAQDATAGLTTIAVRWPAHPVAQALIEASGTPIVAPSANRSGHVSATRAEHVEADLGDAVAMILATPNDTPACEVGVESTIVAQAENGHLVILRTGAINAALIVQITGRPPGERGDVISATPSAPGQLESHYAPKAAVRLNVTSPEAGDALLAFGSSVPVTGGPIRNLSQTGDLDEAAANLYRDLRELDLSGAKTISVMPIPAIGIGIAINDRLRRAAAPR